MIQRRLTRIEVFAFEEPWPVHYGMECPGKGKYGILQLTCEGGRGWGAGILSGDEGDAPDLIHWSSYLRSIRHCSVEEALEILDLTQPEWSREQQQILRMALLNLQAKLQRRLAAVTLLAMNTGWRRIAAARDRTGTCALYYRPPITALHRQGWPEPDTAQLIDKSVSYISII